MSLRYDHPLAIRQLPRAKRSPLLIAQPLPKVVLAVILRETRSAYGPAAIGIGAQLCSNPRRIASLAGILALDHCLLGRVGRGVEGGRRRRRCQHQPDFLHARAPATHCLCRPIAQAQGRR